MTFQQIVLCEVCNNIQGVTDRLDQKKTMLLKRVTIFLNII
jgi:hypothetical protein